MAEYRYLVPLDGSRLAEHSLVHLRALARMGDANVLLFSVVDESQEFHHAAGQEAMEREINLLSTYLREVSADFAKHEGINVKTKVVQGLPAECILDEAQTFLPQLLVISTHGRSGPSRWRFGSVADKVIRGAGCNSLVVGSNATRREAWLESDIEPAFGSILVPLDGSALAEEALPVAAFFAKKFGSKLHLLRVVSLPLVGEADPSTVEALTTGARDDLHAAVRRLQVPGVIATAVKWGAPASELNGYVAQNNIDLVVMTSHGRGGVIRAALGSVTDRMLGGEAPVLVVRPPLKQS